MPHLLPFEMSRSGLKSPVLAETVTASQQRGVGIKYSLGCSSDGRGLGNRWATAMAGTFLSQAALGVHSHQAAQYLVGTEGKLIAREHASPCQTSDSSDSSTESKNTRGIRKNKPVKFLYGLGWKARSQ